MFARSSPKRLHRASRTSNYVATISLMNKGCFCKFILKLVTELDGTFPIKASNEAF